jgi:hypothetical protein
VEAIQGLALAALRRGDPLRDLFQDSQPPDGPVLDRARPYAKAAPVAASSPAPAPPLAPAAERGWFAAPEEPPAYFISDAQKARALADDITIMVDAMRANRDRDGAVGADAILFISDGTQYKLYARWYDPDSDSDGSLGDWRYTIVLRHLLDRDDFDSSDLEAMCYFGVDHYVGELSPEDLRVFFRYEYGDKIQPIERFEW